MRQRHRLHRASSRAQAVQRPLHRSPDLRIQALTEVLLRHADPQPGNALGQLRRELWHWRVRRRCIHRIRPGQHLHHGRRIGHRPRQRPHPVQRRPEGNQPIARHAPVGRQHTDHPAERRRLPDRPTGVRPQRRHTQSRSHRRSRPAGRPTRHPVGRPRIPHRLVRGVFVRRSHCKLVAVQLAQHHGSGRLQLRHDGGVVRRMPTRQDLRP